MALGRRWLEVHQVDGKALAGGVLGYSLIASSGKSKKAFLEPVGEDTRTRILFERFDHRRTTALGENTSVVEPEAEMAAPVSALAARPALPAKDGLSEGPIRSTSWSRHAPASFSKPVARLANGRQADPEARGRCCA